MTRHGAARVQQTRRTHAQIHAGRGHGGRDAALRCRDRDRGPRRGTRTRRDPRSRADAAPDAAGLVELHVPRRRRQGRHDQLRPRVPRQHRVRGQLRRLPDHRHLQAQQAAHPERHQVPREPGRRLGLQGERRADHPAAVDRPAGDRAGLQRRRHGDDRRARGPRRRVHDRSDERRDPRPLALRLRGAADVRRHRSREPEVPALLPDAVRLAHAHAGAGPRQRDGPRVRRVVSARRPDHAAGRPRGSPTRSA